MLLGRLVINQWRSRDLDFNGLPGCFPRQESHSVHSNAQALFQLQILVRKCAAFCSAISPTINLKVLQGHTQTSKCEGLRQCGNFVSR